MSDSSRRSSLRFNSSFSLARSMMNAMQSERVFGTWFSFMVRMVTWYSACRVSTHVAWLPIPSWPGTGSQRAGIRAFPFGAWEAVRRFVVRSSLESFRTSTVSTVRPGNRSSGWVRRVRDWYRQWFGTLRRRGFLFAWCGKIRISFRRGWSISISLPTSSWFRFVSLNLRAGRCRFCRNSFSRTQRIPFFSPSQTGYVLLNVLEPCST